VIIGGIKRWKLKSIYDNPEKMLTKDSYPACQMPDGMYCSDCHDQPCPVSANSVSNLDCTAITINTCDSRQHITILLPDGTESILEVGADCSDEYHNYVWTGDVLKITPNICTCESSISVEGDDAYYINVWEDKLDFNRIILENKDCFAVILSDIKGYYGLMIEKNQQHWDNDYYTVCRGVSMKNQELVFTEPQENNKFWFFSRNGRIHWNSYNAFRKEIEMVKENMVPSKRSDLGVYRILK
jgi:hypothetical protein